MSRKRWRLPEDALDKLQTGQHRCCLKDLLPRKAVEPAAKKHKFNARAVVIDNIRFDSLKEGRYYQELKLRVKAGEVLFFLRQVPFDLPGNVKYRLDFLEFHADGSAHYVDVKGVQTKEFIMKKKQVEALYPVIIEVV
jgi:hypothetical protein